MVSSIWNLWPDPCLVALMMAQVEGVTQPAPGGGYLLTNPGVPTADVTERFSRSSKTPGLAKSRAGGCLTVDLMNREKSDIILTYAWSDAVLHSCAFEFCSCLHFNSFPSYCFCVITLSFSPSLPLYSLTSSRFWGEISSLVAPTSGSKDVCSSDKPAEMPKKPALCSRAGWHTRQLSSCWEVIAEYK